MERTAFFLTSMSGELSNHPDEEMLERFILNRCEDGELEVIETHVIGCESCVQKLEILEEDLLNLKSGGELYLRYLARKNSGAKRSWFRFFAVPAISMAGALAACLCISTLAVRDVTLSAYRDSQITIVPQWRPLRMHLNASDLPAGPVTVQIVDEQGGERWKGAANISGDQVQVEVPAIRQSGEHFIRLEDRNGELLREFAVQPKLVP